MSGDKDDIKTIRILQFSGKEDYWDEWSEKFKGIAAERGYLDIMLGSTTFPGASVNIDEKKPDNTDVLSAQEKKEVQIVRNANLKGHRDLQLSTTGLSFTLVKLSKSSEYPSRDLFKAWQSL